MNKLIKKSFHRKDSGFTLIELLIVIVIIGILAGVLIAVINPVRQQNRARNAAVRSSMMKIAFAVNTVRAGIGRLPANSELRVELENMVPLEALCDETDTGHLSCAMKMSGTPMPETCGGSLENVYVPGSGAEDCYLVVQGVGGVGGSDLTTGQFRLVGPKFNLDTVNPDNRIYVFDSQLGLLDCPGDITGVLLSGTEALGDLQVGGTDPASCFYADE